MAKTLASQAKDGGSIPLARSGVSVITGVHAVMYTNDAEGLRAFVRDVLGFPSVDAGGGWLIFALPPAELAAHPAEEDGRHELYLMCDDIVATVDELERKGVEFTGPVTEAGFGLMTAIKLPGGGELGLYEPRHPTPLAAVTGS
jgi:catechol 2,3-dioxygenase-like lactoylglutathione lyase family enzyme